MRLSMESTVIENIDIVPGAVVERGVFNMDGPRHHVNRIRLQNIAARLAIEDQPVATLRLGLIRNLVVSSPTGLS